MRKLVSVLAHFEVVLGVLLSVHAAQAPGQRGQRGRGQQQSQRKQVLAWADIRFGAQHESVSRALATIDRLGEQSGLWDTYIRTDSDVITKEQINGKNLNSFDAIFFYGVREIALNPEQRASLMSFIKEDGKGFVAAHTATTAFFSWPEFGEMLGGRFDGHPWGVTEARVIVEDQTFPAMQHFQPLFTLREEHYQIKDFSRDKLRIFARLDPSSLDLTRPNVNRKDGDFPVVWGKMHGKGRVFYSAFGHERDLWSIPSIQRMWLEAMKWSLGMTQGDVTPRPMPPSK
ncbi:MAG: ThuA domain-containing protein [Acidobacteria bacterium]|nr:ThuA domain-containing protein [Acidobacteriota bacterium]